MTGDEKDGSFDAREALGCALMKGILTFVIGVALGASACTATDEPGLDPAIELGFHRAGGYEVLADGGTCWVADAVQGGYWTMPAVRTQGLGDEANVTCSVTDDVTGDLGELSTYRFFGPAPDAEDTLEIQQFLLPLEVVDDQMFAALPGRTGSIMCSVRDDDDVEIDIELSVVFDTEAGGPIEE